MLMFSFSTSGVNVRAKCQESWLHRWDLYSVSSLWWHLGATPGAFHPVWKMLLAQLYSNHTRTPSARWPKRKDARGHSSTCSVFIHIPAREVFHYTQVIAACGLHAFLSVQHNKLSKSNMYKQERSSITCCKQQHASLKNTLTFDQETSTITLFKQQHASLKNTLTFEQETCPAQNQK